jgi:hypothetical protein
LLCVQHGLELIESTLTHHAAIHENDKKAGTDQDQHDAMVQIITGRSWARSDGQRRNAQQDAAKGYEVAYESHADFVRLPFQNSRSTPRESESAQQFHNCRGHDARLVKCSDGKASVLDSIKEKESSVYSH